MGSLAAVARRRPWLRRPLRAVRRFLRLLSPGYRRLDGLPGRIHPWDPMASTDLEAYRRVGLEGRRLVDDGLAAAGRTASARDACLDMGCGYGRVLRHLEGSVTAADVDQAAVAFCAAEFRAEPLIVPAAPDELSLPRSYAAVWVGSLFTHLPRRAAEVLFVRLAAALDPGGILVFTLHGPACLAWPQIYRASLPPAEMLAAELRATGHVFVPYPWDGTYGVAFGTDDFVTTMLERCCDERLSLVQQRSRGWDDHQDVYVVARRNG